MTQISRHLVSKDIQKRMYDVFLDTLAGIKIKSDVSDFINDFFTPTERIMLPKRLTIALLLIKGYDQRTIIQYLKVSFATITRVSNILKDGGEGYKKVIEKIIKDEKFSDMLEKIDNNLADVLGPVGPGSLDWKKWRSDRWKKKYEISKPF
jgi:Trp operon repressor